MGVIGVNMIVGVSDAKISCQGDDVLTTYALGSCIGVALYDTAAGIGGLLHYQLPSSTADPERGREKPLMFADTGLAWMFGEMAKMGAQKRRLRVRLAGGAKMLNDSNLFDIGRRNHVAIRKLMWQNGMFIDSEHIGGTVPRNMELKIRDGSVVIKCNQEM